MGPPDYVPRNKYFVNAKLSGTGSQECGLNSFSGAELLGTLNLSGSQRERLESILDDQEDRLEAYWECRMPEMRAIVEQTYDEIRVVLTPQQRAAFDERVRAQRTRMPESIRD